MINYLDNHFCWCMFYIELNMYGSWEFVQAQNAQPISSLCVRPEA